MTGDTAADHELLASGTASDFDVFYRRHLQGVVSYVARRMRRPDLVFDIVAETFARALAHRDQYDTSRGPAIAWLYGIARNEVAGAARRGRVAADCRKQLGMQPIAVDDAALAAIERRASVDLRDALAGLPAHEREAVLGRVLAEESYAAIAQRVGCSEQVVRKRVSRGLARMRRTLEEKA